MEVVLNLAGDCVHCNRAKVNREQWVKIPRDVRVDMRDSFTSDGGARGLCNSCDTYLRKTNPDKILDYERRTLSLEIFVEEYTLLSEQGVTDEEIARKLGLFRAHTKRDTRSARMDTFNRAMRRAREAGLL